ncbi:hypothetical protein ACFQO4_12430 [Saliphagus sp. GCM10025334]|nr:hypothetical protein [Natronosalvus caseinilyticus]
MECDNCATNDSIAYTLKTHLESEPSETVDLHFCSSRCLGDWT